MFAPHIYRMRREALLQQVASGPVLLLGNEEVGMNYKANTFPFRQDSTFLYFAGIQQPSLALWLDPATGQTTLLGDEATMEDIVWTGPLPTLAEVAAQADIHQVEPADRLATLVKEALAAGRTVHFLPPYRHHNRWKLSQLLGVSMEDVAGKASEALIRAVVAQRAHKAPEEVAEMERALGITASMHLAVMMSAKPGKKESELMALAESIAMAHQGRPAYGTILTINGQILHNHDYTHILPSGRLLLGDFGAETARCYAGDITRTIPVDARFTGKQKEIYQVALEAQMTAIAACKPGITYREVHDLAALAIARGLTEIGLMKGDPAEAVAAGAHALFFPHGLGHMIGLDVHDMEDLGENNVGYSDEVTRSTQFGTAYLRLARRLEPGFVLTVEPGIYFIPELADQWHAEGLHHDFIAYEKFAVYRDFGGIRIEDNVLITPEGHRVLGPAIPKTIEAVEELRKAALG